MKTIITVLLVTAFTSGCAGLIKTNEVPAATAVPVPKERTFAFQEPEKDSAVVSITRDNGVLGSACYLAVEANGKLVARMDPGETVKFYVSPGSQELTVASDPMGSGLCALGWEPVKRTYQLKNSGENKFRLSSRQYRRPALEQLY